MHIIANSDELWLNYLSLREIDGLQPALLDADNKVCILQGQAAKNAPLSFDREPKVLALKLAGTVTAESDAHSFGSGTLRKGNRTVCLYRHPFKHAARDLETQYKGVTLRSFSNDSEEVLTFDSDVAWAELPDESLRYPKAAYQIALWGHSDRPD